MSDGWDDVASSWDDEPATRAYAAAAAASLRDVLDGRGRDLASSVVLDFGCGTGLLTERIVDTVAAVDAIDTSSAMLDVVRAKAADREWSSVVASTEIPDVTGRYDLVVASSVCAFLDDYPGTVARIAGTMRPGGLFVQWDWEAEPGDPHGLTRSAVHDALSGAGLIDVEVDTAFEVQVDGVTMRPLMGVATAPTA